MAAALWATGLLEGDQAGTVPPWKGGVSAEGRPVPRPESVWGLRGTDRAQVMHHRLESPAAAAPTEVLLLQGRCLIAAVLDADMLQSFESVAALIAPVAASVLAAAHFVVGVVAFAAFVAVVPVFVAGDIVAAFVAFAAVAFVAAAAGVDAAVAAAGGDDASVAAAFGAEVAAEFWAVRHRPGFARPCFQEKQGNTQMGTVACWVQMMPGRAATLVPAGCETAQVADSGAPCLCGDKLATEPDAWQRQRAAPTPALFPDSEPAWHLCKPPQVLAAGFLPQFAGSHHRGCLCGSPSDP